MYELKENELYWLLYKDGKEYMRFSKQSNSKAQMLNYLKVMGINLKHE